MQNRCTRILWAQGESRSRIQPGWRVESGAKRGRGGEAWKKNHYTARGWKNCHKECHYFSSGTEKVNCAYCNSTPSLPRHGHRKPLNNLGTFQDRSFPFSLHSLRRVQGRGAQSTWLKETLTHRNMPCLSSSSSSSSSPLSSPTLSVHTPSFITLSPIPPLSPSTIVLALCSVILSYFRRSTLQTTVLNNLSFSLILDCSSHQH